MGLGGSEHLDIYRKNIKVIKKIGPQLITKLECTGLEINYEETASKSGQKNIRVEVDGRRVYLHSSFDPRAEAQKLDCIREEDEADTLVILGLGLGYHIDYFMKKYPDKNKIIIEPDINILKCCLMVKSFEGILDAKKVQLILSDSTDGIVKELMRLYNLTLISKVTFIALNSYLSFYRDFWDQLHIDFARAYRDTIMNISTFEHFKFIWTRNILKNAMKIPESAVINDFAGKFKGVPGVVVSSGPSLNKSMHLLDGLYNRAVIVSAGSSINSLLLNGKKPHIMLGVDGGEYMSEMYNKVDRDDIILAYILNLHEDCLDKYKGQKLYLRTNTGDKATYIDEGLGLNSVPVYSGPSCANISTDFLYHLGCDPIIFIGQDLCYTDGKAHAQGYIENASSKNNDARKRVHLKNMYGEDVTTTNSLLSMKNWFEKYIELRNGDRTFINASASGLSIKGTVEMSLEDVIEKYCMKDLDIEERLFRICMESRNGSRIGRSEVYDFYRRLAGEAKESIDWSKQRIEIVEGVLKKLKAGKTSGIVEKREKMDKITNKMEKTDFYKHFIYSNMGDFSQIIKSKVERDADKNKDIVKKLEILYEGLKKQYSEVLSRGLHVEQVLSGLMKLEDSTAKEL